ncbi:MAG: hypothetical protein A2096_11290 [Spirochaetes bacterium GWF1_41_5]|nr:MAG: hypothetical protein A2096_11290 [Spirochaetes bacterium GWF1_41_5]
MINATNVMIENQKYNSIKPEKNYKGRKLNSKTAQKQVKIGIVGAAGDIINFVHLPNLKRNPKAHFSAFCDRNIEKVNAIIKEKSYEVDYVTDNYDQMLDDSEIQLIIAGLPHEIHHEVIKKASQAGKDIFIEKPMGLSPNECLDLLPIIKKSGIRVMIGHNRRFAPSYIDAKNIYQNSMHTKPAILTYRVADPLPQYYEYEIPEGGRIYGEECHFFDLLAWFLEDEPIKIYTEGDLLDFQITIKFKRGSRAVLTSSAQGGMGIPKELFECHADYQSIIVEGNVCLTHAGNHGDYRIINYPLHFDPYPDIPNTSEGYRLRMKKYAIDNFQGKFKTFSQPFGSKGHYEELDECMNAILENRRFAADEIDGARAVLCCDAAVRSLQTGHPEELDFSDFRLKQYDTITYNKQK